MALINVAKTALRLTTDALDEELYDEIEACLLRLHLAGAEGEDEDPLVKDAVRTRRGMEELLRRYPRRHGTRGRLPGSPGQRRNRRRML